MNMYNPYTNNPYNFNYNGDLSRVDRVNYFPNSSPQLANNYSNYQMNNNQAMIGFDCKPVTSIDEAKAATVKLDGNPSYMVDINAKSIYEKKLDMNTGAANFKIYKLVENYDTPKQTDFSEIQKNIVSKDDFIKLDEKVSALSDKQDDILLNLKNLIMNGEMSNESNTNNNVNVKSKSNSSISGKK